MALSLPKAMKIEYGLEGAMISILVPRTFSSSTTVQNSLR